MKISRRTPKQVALVVAVVTGMILTPALRAQAGQIDIGSPPGSEAFGTSVTALPNGNIVVTDPLFDAGVTVDAGAVYLYDGATGALISILTGSTVNDQIGSGGVVVLNNGNYVVSSPQWQGAGAVTWGSGTSGISGLVSASNSLVGSTFNDQVGYSLFGTGVMALSNGNYVVSSPDWDNDGTTDAGAVTWGNGTSGTSGVISATNSLVGNSANDEVGSLIELTNGNYVVSSPAWNNGGVPNAGAVTWGDGTSGVSGEISAANSLVGSTAYDEVGSVYALNNGNYVVRSRDWDNGGVTDAGAVTWGDGTSGVSGEVSTANSLVGSSDGDQVGNVVALSNGDYVVSSPDWDNGVVTDTGAVTWVDGMSGITGAVPTANSLVGSTADGRVGSGGVTELSNGNYVVSSPDWDDGMVTDVGAVTWVDWTSGTSGLVSAANSLVGSSADDRVGAVIPLSNGHYLVPNSYWDNGGATNAGAVTWGNGMSGVSGEVSAANSLVGSSADDQIGSLADGGVYALSNGNYVVVSPDWDNGGVTDAGAVTWVDGTNGITGVVSSANSLVGSTAYDQVGSGVDGDTVSGVTELKTGDYVVSSPEWDNGGATNAGAVTWGDGTSAITGEVSAANSLVGSTADDEIGGLSSSIMALSNGHYLVISLYWDDGWAMDAGAVTWGNGTSGITGVVSLTNSLVGSSAADVVGEGGVVELRNGHYVVSSPRWDNGGTTDAGAVTVGWGATGARGPITSTNSVLGTTANGGDSMVFDYDYVNYQLIVGRPADNIVTLLRFTRVYLPLVLKDVAP